MQITAIVGAVCLTIGLLTGWYTTSDHYKLKIAESEINAYEQGKAAGVKSVKVIEGVVNEKVIYKTKWKTKYKDKLVYIDRTNDCTLDADSMLLWNQAISDSAR